MKHLRCRQWPSWLAESCEQALSAHLSLDSEAVGFQPSHLLASILPSVRGGGRG